MCLIYIMYHVLALSGALSLYLYCIAFISHKDEHAEHDRDDHGDEVEEEEGNSCTIPYCNLYNLPRHHSIIFDFNTLSRHVANNTDTTNMTKLFRTRLPIGPQWRWVCSMTIKCHIKHGREKVMICDNIVSQRVLESLLTTSPILIFTAQDTRDMVWPFGSRGWNQLLLAANKKLPLVQWMQLRKMMQQSC